MRPKNVVKFFDYEFDYVTIDCTPHNHPDPAAGLVRTEWVVWFVNVVDVILLTLSGRVFLNAEKPRDFLSFSICAMSINNDIRRSAE